MLQRPSDRSTDLRERSNYARALRALGRVKEAVEECEKVLSEAGDKSRIRDLVVLELIDFFERFRDSMKNEKSQVRDVMAKAAPHQVFFQAFAPVWLPMLKADVPISGCGIIGPRCVVDRWQGRS